MDKQGRFIRMEVKKIIFISIIFANIINFVIADNNDLILSDDQIPDPFFKVLMDDDLLGTYNQIHPWNDIRLVLYSSGKWILRYHDRDDHSLITEYGHVVQSENRYFLHPLSNGFYINENVVLTVLDDQLYWEVADNNVYFVKTVQRNNFRVDFGDDYYGKMIHLQDSANQYGIINIIDSTVFSVLDNSVLLKYDNIELWIDDIGHFELMFTNKNDPASVWNRYNIKPFFIYGFMIDYSVHTHKGIMKLRSGIGDYYIKNGIIEFEFIGDELILKYDYYPKRLSLLDHLNLKDYVVPESLMDNIFLNRVIRLKNVPKIEDLDGYYFFQY